MRKRLVVCFDGTWNRADAPGGIPTNVLRLARAVRGAGPDGTLQIVLYLHGPGSFGRWLTQLLEGVRGIGVDDSIRSAYMFLAQNYSAARIEDGKRVEADDIYLFGFSRGAFAARSLVGLITTTGLLKRGSLGDLPLAWNYFQMHGRRSSRDFSAQHGSMCHHNLDIAFLGVWDTVGSFGVPRKVLGFPIEENHEFHDTMPSPLVRRACHALAIDEHRYEFDPTLWTGETPPGCSIEQTWFSGTHSDVGGGYPERELADISLDWMAQNARKAGLDIEEARLQFAAPMRNPLAPAHESRFGLSRKDRLIPTIRRICRTDFSASRFERTFITSADMGEALPTINETIHPSAIQRYGKRVTTVMNAAGDRKRSRYKPKNLAAAMRLLQRSECPPAG